MPSGRTKTLWKIGACSAAAFAIAITTLAPKVASAHFILKAPASWMSQDSAGAPEKLGPCGDEGGGTPTGIVTAFQSGQSITVTIDEVVFHPGHYRVALAVNDRSELPAEPPVTATPATPCGSVPIESPPVFPVLADDLFDHTTPFTTPQSAQITLPSNVTCTHCTLQVIEFMSDHPLNNPGGCFYHHCADISIGVDAGTTGSGDASASSGSDAAAPASDGGSPVTTDVSSSNGCSVGRGEAPAFGGAAMLILLTTTGLRRRKTGAT
jgi:hypothetical protein